MYGVLEHIALILSHLAPNTKHTETAVCLICRHYHQKSLRGDPLTIYNHVDNRRFPSENELSSTGNFAPKYLTYDIALRNSVVHLQLVYILHNLNYVDAGLACSEQPPHTGRTVRVKNAVVGLCKYLLSFSTLKHAVTFFSGGAWTGCEKLVVFGVGGDPRLWSSMVASTVSHLERQGPAGAACVELALFVWLGSIGQVKNFSAWMKQAGGRVSPRVLVQRGFLDFHAWGQHSYPWDISFFV